MATATTFVTSNGHKIPGATMERVRARLAADEDWQLVAYEELRQYIPNSDDDLDDVNEVLSAAEGEDRSPPEDERDGFDPFACPGCGGNCARACR